MPNFIYRFICDKMLIFNFNYAIDNNLFVEPYIMSINTA